MRFAFQLGTAVLWVLLILAALVIDQTMSRAAWRAQRRDERRKG